MKLEDAWDQYLRAVDDFAKKMFAEVVRPWLTENNYSFITGMGIWFVRTPDGFEVDEKDIPQYVRIVLETEINGLPANDLGSMMPSYHQPVVKMKPLTGKFSDRWD